MQMGDVIRFPLERVRPPEHEVEILGPMDECAGLIHVFNEVPGRCKCGQNEWTPEHTIEPDGIGLHGVFDFAPPPAS
jgi:hypothetical protein